MSSGREIESHKNLMLFSGRAFPELASEVAEHLGVATVPTQVYDFANGEIFVRFEERMDTALVAPEDRLPELEDIWLQLHLVFECISEYRFLYRDIVDILVSGDLDPTLRARGAMMRRPPAPAPTSLPEVPLRSIPAGRLNLAATVTFIPRR